VKRAAGISVHTGWAACVVAGGSPRKPEIAFNAELEILGDDERFCFHMAAEMKPAEAEKWIAQVRRKALTNARKAMAPLAKLAGACAIVAKPGDPGTLEHVLASHPRIHAAEGCFYRDVLTEASPIPARVAPKAIDISGIGKIAPPPWGRDQKLAAAAAWMVLDRPGA
jgi:hypothetical protein